MCMRMYMVSPCYRAAPRARVLWSMDASPHISRSPRRCICIQTARISGSFESTRQRFRTCQGLNAYRTKVQSHGSRVIYQRNKRDRRHELSAQVSQLAGPWRTDDRRPCPSHAITRHHSTNLGLFQVMVVLTSMYDVDDHSVAMTPRRCTYICTWNCGSRSNTDRVPLRSYLAIRRAVALRTESRWCSYAMLLHGWRWCPTPL
ncbi:hypothetical protein C8Q80DRAFT_198198 [Daedaleopsis nitida]|nr:hypothetical protein C8Q80DRAFT_198198 [Daedaleopsis nitida]